MRIDCEEIEGLIRNGKEVYQRMLQYFGEDLNLTSGEFFTTFQQFVEVLLNSYH